MKLIVSNHSGFTEDGINSSDFLIYKADFKFTDDEISNLAFHCELWFRQSNKPLFVSKVNDRELTDLLPNRYITVNLGLFNDDSVRSSDERALQGDAIRKLSSDIEKELRLLKMDKSPIATIVL